MQATNLKTNHLTQPLGIDAGTLFLSWQCAEGVRQTAYEIEVTAGTETLWASGKILSSVMRTETPTPVPPKTQGQWCIRLWDENDQPGAWSEAVFETGLHIVVDAGNGVGGFYADQVLAPLGADVSGSQFLEPDGMFPNHIPNPENKGAIDAASKMVLDSSADLGLIFDTDVDRMGCIGATGQEINRNTLVALAAAIVLEDHPGTTVVTDSLTSDGLRTFIEQNP